MTIENGKNVKAHYTLKVDNQVVDSSQERGPLEFVQGSHQLILGFEQNIEGLNAGDKKSFSVSPEKGYGVRNPEALISVDREKFPEGEIKKGMAITATREDGKPLQGFVQAFEGEKVIVDFNHPLAGKTLNFEVEIVEIA